MSNFIESRPQRLCKMCGKCCRVVTAPVSYKEMLSMAENNDEGAKDFLSIFEPYSSVGAARNVHADVVDNIISALKDAGESTEDITFYKCKYLLDNNLCGRYESRLELCDRFPSTPWAVIPPGCGFEGWLFQKQEEIKRNIRKQKEYLIEFEAELKTLTDQEQIKKIEDAIVKIKEIVSAYEKYGSIHW